MNPVLRAVIAQKWQQTAVDANIHALIGQNSDKLVNDAGRVFFVVLGAVMDSKDVVDKDAPDVRILRGAVNAIYDQAGEAEIGDLRRGSITAGLLAAQRLSAMLPRKLLVDSACELHEKLRRQDVLMSDFERLVA